MTVIPRLFDGYLTVRVRVRVRVMVRVRVRVEVKNRGNESSSFRLRRNCCRHNFDSRTSPILYNLLDLLAELGVVEHGFVEQPKIITTWTFSLNCLRSSPPP